MHYEYHYLLIELIFQNHRDTTKEGDIIIVSQRFRTQTQNLQDAWEKLFTFVKNIVELPGYTALASQERKQKLYYPRCIQAIDFC